MGNSIVIYYIYEYFKYYVDNDLAYTTGASVKETWDDNACKSKFMVSIVTATTRYYLRHCLTDRL